MNKIKRKNESFDSGCTCGSVPGCQLRTSQPKGSRVNRPEQCPAAEKILPQTDLRGRIEYHVALSHAKNDITVEWSACNVEIQ
jgi:hypothetical protein